MLLLRFKELEKAARRPPQKTYRLFKIIEYTVLLKEATIMKKETEVIRVAAYCRVSTDKLDQANSLESQQRYFNEYIARNPLWELYEIYVDEGITGTNTFKREDFNRMIKDGKDGKFDLIITKEVSRFARNLLDSIAYTRELREYGIRLIFLNDNIDTDQPDHEFRLAMMASLAQEESRKTSERVKWGQRRRMEQGVVFGRDMLGYDVRDGKLIVNEEPQVPRRGKGLSCDRQRTARSGDQDLALHEGMVVHGHPPRAEERKVLRRSGTAKNLHTELPLPQKESQQG